jgi:hypothetical protein
VPEQPAASSNRAVLWIGVVAVIAVVGIIGYNYLSSTVDQIFQNVGESLASTAASVAASATRTTRPTPLVTPAPISDFDPVVLSGTGSGVPRFTIPETVAAIAEISHRGTANFAVWSVDEDGQELALLVNTIGNYTGTVLFDAHAGEHSVAFEVDADGAWTITVKPIWDAYEWDQTAAVTGTGDDVVILNPATSGLKSTMITHHGSSNFAVIGYGAGIDLLVNEIGDYSGESLLSDSTFLLEITADGSWSISPPS